MCKYCFDEELLGFTSIDRFFSLENRAQERLIKKHLKLIDEKSVSSIDFSKAEESQYLCKSCNEIWILSIQEDFKRSFLIKEKHLKKYRNHFLKKDRLHKNGCIAALILIISFFTYWFTFNS